MLVAMICSGRCSLRALTLAVLGGPLSCASPTPAPAEVPELSASSKTVVRVPVGSVERKEVDQTVEAGLGAFLQRVTVEPVMEGEKFIGFRLVELDSAMTSRGVDIRVGDVLLQVNGHSLEAETEAFDAFEGLRTAPEVRLSLLRNGKPQQVVIPIVGEPTSAPTPPASDAGVASQTAG